MAVGAIVVDGNFNDWVGQPSLADPVDGGFIAIDDITRFGWATNPNEERLYFMIERKTYLLHKLWPAHFILYIDGNDNGNYGDKHDYYIDIEYKPLLGSVDVDVYDRKGKPVASYIQNGGQIAGVDKVEFSVPMTDLGIIPPSQTIRMYVVGVESHDRVPNGGDIQWSPIPIMPSWLLATIFVAGLIGAVIILKKRRVVC
ncbi:MAG: hypothetical protein GXY34_10015 [Syntrophomonadaceae bacterium]|nr:hypothetical protein [Syntrophomonadaceae bacterium]